MKNVYMDQFHFILLLSAILITVLGQGENKPPSWDTSSVSNLTKGISEATPVGTSLAKLSCIDPENDMIIYYIRSGKAVRVSFDGYVTLAVPLDFEAKDTLGYDLTFTCVDVNSVTGNPLHSEVENRIQFTVDDANDNPPVFEVDNAEGYTFFIPENAPIGSILSPSIRTRDKDRTINAVLDKLYIVCNSPYSFERANLSESSVATCQHFRIDYKQEGEGVYSANLSLTALLDYETRPVYTSKLYAIDGSVATYQFTTTVNIQINVIDQEDVNPFFTNPGASGTVSEGAVIGSTLSFAISAQDGDTGIKRPVVIDIISDEKKAFNLTSTNASVNLDGIYEAKLIVNNRLDRETMSGAYPFVVKVTELDNGVRTNATATATYSIFVTDVNDNAPTFENSVYNITLAEIDNSYMNQQIQIPGLHIKCYDLDEPSNARYNVTIQSQTFDAYSVSPVVTFTGNASMFLRVNNPSYLDYDSPANRQQTVILVAREVSTQEQYSGSTTIYINLQDINDNAPVFSQSAYNFSIIENVQSFTFTDIRATDTDSGSNGQIRYSLQGETDNLFTIDYYNGTLYMKGKLDYETTPIYVFTVYATDQGTPNRTTPALVIINILNFNDQGPHFVLPSYQTAVNESSLVFQNPIVVHAVDDEDGSFISYRILSGQSPNNAFVMNSITGELTLRAFLNFDDTPLDSFGNKTGVFVLLVETSDNGSPPQNNTAEIRVRVIDENNHSPVLSQTVFTKTISEIAQPGTSIAQLTATDLDSGDFGKITYRMGGGQSDNFFVNPNNGLITVAIGSLFDYEPSASNEYTFTIYATDGGAPQRSATATIIVTVTDADNKDPTFRDLIYLGEIDETTAINKLIVQLTATDPDSKALLTYFIDPNSIVAKNSNGNQLTSTNQYDYKNVFGVRGIGEIYLKGLLNKTLAQNFQFTFVCRDLNTEQGIGNGTIQIAISITGKPDSGISFDPINQIFLNEDVGLFNNPITVTARDTSNVPVTNYTKLSGSSFFYIDQTTGRVILQKKLDYETDPEVDHLHRVVIAANSKGFSATVTVTISIVDVNDNNPLFSQPNYEAWISESALYPTEVVFIYATDADSSSYAPLNFTISGGFGAEDFMIYQEPVPSGSLTSRRAHVLVAQGTRLNYNKRSDYDLTLLVNDNMDLRYSQVRRYDSAFLKIHVLDENNNIPVFKEVRRSLSVPENADIGQSIATVIATDADQGDNGKVQYSLVSSDYIAVQLFTVIQDVGTINVARSLLGLGGHLYSMSVKACDKGDPPQCGSQMALDIYVLSIDNDDGNPKWITPSVGYVLFAPEETPNYILNINNNTKFFGAVPRHGNVTTFGLSPYSPFASSFKINITTGEITIVDRLDREVQETYNLLIYAIDNFNGTIYRTGRQFYVTLIDKNDNDPSFTNPKNYVGCVKIDRPLIVSVSENTPANVSVFTLRACDPDGPGNNAIYYRLFNGSTYCDQQNNLSAITIDVNGTLITRKMLDYEQDKEFNLCVEAVSVVPSRRKRSLDMSEVNATLDNVAYINVQIIDMNDNGPKFPSSQAYGVVEVVPNAGPALQMNAVDPDGPGNNQVLYRIESSIFYPQDGSAPRPLAGAFILRSDKKAIYPAFPTFADYSGGHFDVTVVASDPTNSSVSDKQIVSIFIYDPGHALKIILNLQPGEGFTRAKPLVEALSGVSSSYYFSYLQASQDTSNAARTDVCFLAVRIDSNSKTILNIREVADLLDQSNYKDILNQAIYQTVDRGQCYPSQSSERKVKWRNLWWVLVALAIFLFVCCLILIILVTILYESYKNYMLTKKTYMVSQ